MRPDERETKIMTNNEKECGTLRSVRAVDGKLKCNLEWPNPQYRVSLQLPSKLDAHFTLLLYTEIRRVSFLENVI